MIEIKIKCNDEEERDELRDRLCEALVGSPAYVDSEIAICDEGDDGFILVVGNPNAKNVAFELDGSSIELQ